MEVGGANVDVGLAVGVRLGISVGVRVGMKVDAPAGTGVGVFVEVSDDEWAKAVWLK